MENQSNLTPQNNIVRFKRSKPGDGYEDYLDTLTLAALRVLEYRGTEFNTSSQQDDSLAIAYPNFLQEVSRRIDVLFDTMPREQFNHIMNTFTPDNEEILNPNYPSSAIPDYGFTRIGIDQKN